jgi:hypothetical protein
MVWPAHLESITTSNAFWVRGLSLMREQYGLSEILNVKGCKEGASARENARTSRAPEAVELGHS